jgi:hypothetical protein
MGRKLAAMAFADPPYNVKIKATVGRGKGKHREFALASGEMSAPQFINFLKKWMRLAAQYSEDGSIHYICMDWRHLTEILNMAMTLQARPPSADRTRGATGQGRTQRGVAAGISANGF